jgi:GAF domain-containing protein
MQATRHARIPVPEKMVKEWQALVDVMAGIVQVPAGLIMHLVDPDIEVLVSSQTEGNPFQKGDARRVWGSGTYCETVLKRKETLAVPNALTDPDWQPKPGVKRDMISYLGMPLLWPDGEPFGTLCVFDEKENTYSALQQKLLAQLRGVLEGQLELVYVNHRLGAANRSLMQLLEEIETLRGILPICSYCKDVRNDQGYWDSVENYVTDRTHAKFSHSICPDCYSSGKPFEGPA